VTVTPDARRIAVFRRGICNGLNGKIAVGSQVDPNSVVGDNLLWKNAQKNEMKKNTSEITKFRLWNFRTFLPILFYIQLPL
jgi:hypothetical protein